LKSRATFEVDRWRLHVGEPRSASNVDTATELHLRLRLENLKRMGLLTRAGNDWLLDGDFETSLRTMQKTHDRLKITAEHGVLASDRRLPFRVLRTADIEGIEGRVLVTGQDEASGRNYVLVESIRGEVVQVPQVREIVDLRQHGHLKAGAFVRIVAQHDPTGKLAFDIKDLGDATALLSDTNFLNANAAQFVTDMPEGWSGWLGELRRAALQTSQTRKRNQCWRLCRSSGRRTCRVVQKLPHGR
jgi:hypothetical protein